MSGLFGGSKPSAPAPPPAPKPPPAVDTEAVKAAGDSERKKQRAAAGRAATELTKGKQLSSAEVGTKKLLGQ